MPETAKPGTPHMLVFRLAIFLLLAAAGISFALFALTSNPRYKRTGLRILLGTLIAAFIFFAILIADRLA
jgi:VIT1/CCC1 family predicted Fe2+/Mn2+ transporter